MVGFMVGFMVFAPQPVFAALDQPGQDLAPGFATEGITEGPVDGSGMARFMGGFMVPAVVHANEFVERPHGVVTWWQGGQRG
ncbi:hypothetical protein XACN24_11640 [Xanthomonas albilineans]|uniref:hypothetical protein n=1 Tax=Xanthomonas albilineans TaxID=29447 RepID=UPI0005F34148|nr:hypothetical protein [Xanthomonas albilineans]QHQ29108.1 hypothetical protein XaFJ1_GM002389 [Xanthomonas albilineans]